MSDPTRKNRNRRRRGCRRNQKGGNLGAGYGFPGDSMGAPIVNNLVNWSSIGNCRATTPGYAITEPARMGGLPPWDPNTAPAMKGGKRRKMYGGAYTVNLSAMPNPTGAALLQGGYPEIQRLSCQGSITNPMNPGPHTPSTQPPAPSGWGSASQVLANSWETAKDIAGKIQLGGSQITGAPVSAIATGQQVPFPAPNNNYLDLKAVPGTPGGTGSPFLTSPTAGYDNKPSTWLDSVGAPVQLQLPYDARIANPACLKTGGRRKSRRANRKTGKKSRKGKSRKAGSKRNTRKY